MKALLPIALLLLLSLNLGAQQLSGTIQDAGGAPIPFATVSLYAAADSALVDGTAADIDGRFSITSPDKGSYYLQLSNVGYQPLSSGIFEVDGPGFNKTFPAFTMSENVEILDEVVVEAMQSQATAKLDKLVMNVANTTLSSESNAFEVVKEAPGIHVGQNGELQLNGKSGLTVLINGRSTYLRGEELMAMLKSMPARNIEKIEVISQPSAKYDAEGAAGMIHIILKENEEAGLNGSVYADYTNNQQHLFATGANLNFKKGRWSSFANADFTRRGMLREMSLYRKFVNGEEVALFNQQGTDTRKSLVPTLRLGSDVELGQGHSLGFIANLAYNDSRQDWNTLGQLTDSNPATGVHIDARNNIQGTSLDQTYNLHYTARLDTAGANLTANLDYVRLNNRSDSRFLNSYILLETRESRGEEFTTDNPYSYDIMAARLDYLQPLPSWNGKMEFGAKASHVVSENQLDFFEEVDGAQLPMPERNNQFTYEENIYAAYANFSRRFNDTWNVQAGLRAEYTRSEGISRTLNETTNRSFLNLFPTLSVQQTVSENYALNYSYSRRVNRPRYSNLNPYLFYIDPYTSVQGNPLLRPQYTHAFQLTQSFKGYTLMLGYDLATDFIGEVPSIDTETRTTVLTTGNVDAFRNLSATLVAPLTIGKKISINNTATIARQAYETEIDGLHILNRRLFFSARSSGRIKLPADIIMELTAAYRGPVAYGVYKLEGNWGIDAGFLRPFLDDKLTLSLRVNDIFRSRRIRGTIGLGENDSYIDQYMSEQSVRLGLRYNFSRGQRFQQNRQEQKLEELQRAGG